MRGTLEHPRGVRAIGGAGSRVLEGSGEHRVRQLRPGGDVPRPPIGVVREGGGERAMGGPALRRRGRVVDAHRRRVEDHASGGENQEAGLFGIDERRLVHAERAERRDDRPERPGARRDGDERGDPGGSAPLPSHSRQPSRTVQN